MKKIIKYSILCTFIILSLVLIIEACLPGNLSSQQSNKVGNIISDVIDKTTNENTKYVKPEQIVMDIENDSYHPYDKIQLTTIITPANASNKSIVWSVSDNTIAIVSSNGEVTFLKPGSVEVNALIKDTEIKTSHSFSVIEVPLTSLTINNTINEIFINHSYNFNYSYLPNNVTFKNFKWESTNNDIVTIDSNGIVTALNLGTTMINLYNNDVLFDSISLKVVSLPSDYIELEDIELLINGNSLTTITLIEGEEQPININKIPNNATMKNFISQLSKSGIVKYQNNTIKALKNGETILSIIAEDKLSIKKTINIKVVSKEAIFDINQNQKNLTIKAGTSQKITLVEVQMPTVYKYQYTSSDNEILTVGEDGIITTKKSGIATVKIDCISGDGTITSKEMNVTITRQTFAEKNDNFFYKIRKAIGHFGAFAILALLAGLTCLLFIKKKYIWFFISLCYGFGLAGLTEFIQLHVPGRAGLFDDVLIDFAGYAIGTIVIFLIYYVFYFIRKAKEKAHE